MRNTLIATLSLIALVALTAPASAHPESKTVVTPAADLYLVVDYRHYHGTFYECYSVASSVWKETNGEPGLQRYAEDGVPADTEVADTDGFPKAGRPTTYCIA